MSTKSVPQMNIRRGPGNNIEKSNEKLNNPKETTLRILNYIGNKKASPILIPNSYSVSCCLVLALAI